MCVGQGTLQPAWSGSRAGSSSGPLERMAPPARPPPAEALALMMAQTREAALMQEPPLAQPGSSAALPPDQLSSSSAALPPGLPQESAGSSFAHPLMHRPEAVSAEQAQRPAGALPGGSPEQPQQVSGSGPGRGGAAGPGLLLQPQSEQEGAGAAGPGGAGEEDEDLAMAMPAQPAGAAASPSAGPAAPQGKRTGASAPASPVDLPSTSARLQEAAESDPLGAVHSVRPASAAQQPTAAPQTSPHSSPGSTAPPQASSPAQPPSTTEAAEGDAQGGAASAPATPQRQLTRELSELDYVARQGDGSLARRFRPTAELDPASAPGAEGGASREERMPAAGTQATGAGALGMPSSSQAMDAEGFFSGVAEAVPVQAPARPAEVSHAHEPLGEDELAPAHPAEVVHAQNADGGGELAQPLEVLHLAGEVPATDAQAYAASVDHSAVAAGAPPPSASSMDGV